MDDKYLKRVRDNILPLSKLQTLPAAIEEWEFTGDVIDHEDSIHECQVCDQQGLRYHFKIANRETLHHLWIGSECILKWGVAVMDDQGQRLAYADARRKLDGLVEGMQQAACLKALAAVSDAEKSNAELRAIMLNYKHQGVLTPVAASEAIWRMKWHGIKHELSFFKITLREGYTRRQLQRLPADRALMLWPALTPAQRKLAVKLGHVAPPGAPVRVAHRMTGAAKVRGLTYKAMRNAGWTDALLVQHGYMLPSQQPR